MSQASLENEINQQKARFEKDLLDQRAKIDTLERENGQLKQRLQLATAGDKENAFIEALEGMHVQYEKRNEDFSKKITEMEGVFRGKKREFDGKDAQIVELNKKLKQLTYAVEEKDREIASLKGKPEERRPRGSDATNTEDLTKILESKLNGQRMECPTCLEADGPAPILRNLWICPDHFLEKHEQPITDMPLDELDQIAKEEAFCANCIQHSHRRCQSDMINLLELKKQYIGEKMIKFLDGIKCLERLGQQVPKMSAQSAEERIKKKINEMVRNDRLKAVDVDEKVEKLIVSLAKFAQGTAEMEAKMQETMRKMTDIEIEAE